LFQVVGEDIGNERSLYRVAQIKRHHFACEDECNYRILWFLACI